jgi:Leucine-rich repeat (LRR) protein
MIKYAVMEWIIGCRLKFCIIIFFLFTACNTGSAQYVTIPDTGFLTWLNSNGFSNCLTGNQMDTLCADTVIVPGDTLYLSNLGIRDVTGLRFVHFYTGVNWPMIDLSHNNLTTIQPDLIYKMDGSENEVVDLDYNQIDTLNFDSIWVYGGTPFSLTLEHNGLRAVVCDSFVIDNYFYSLDLNYNNLTTLPVSSLGWNGGLSVRHNLLTHYPAFYARYMDCGANFIADTINGVPSSGSLACDSNLIPYIRLYSYPDYAGLICSHNLINSMPGLLELAFLDCSYNSITVLDSLDNLTALVANNNNLTSISHLNTNLTRLDVSNNPLLHCIPNLPNVPSLELDFANTSIACLPRQFPQCVYTGTPGIDSVPTCDLFNNIYECPQYSNLEGYAYFDTIPNCVMNYSEPVLPYVKTSFSSNGSVVQQCYTDYMGHYSFDEINYGTYVLSVDTTDLAFLLNCPDSFYYSATVDSQELYQSGFNFGFNCKAGFDVGVFAISNGTFFHPGNTTIVSLDAGDMSALYGLHCAAGIAGQVNLAFNGPVTYVGPVTGSLVPNSVVGNTITWNIADYGTINPFTAFVVEFVTDSGAQNNTAVCFMANVTPLVGDNYPGNNTGFMCSNVVTAWDPNGKEVYPAGMLDSSQRWLTYNVHFQNTGSGAATNIYILDTLDSSLDPVTFKLLGFSHQNVTQVLPGGVVKFSFPFIDLPDSLSSDSASTGYIQYMIKLKANLPPGTIISNSASIYFDFNAPIITNFVYDTIMSTPSGIQTFGLDNNFTIYPNPSMGICQLAISDQLLGGTTDVFDATGRIVFHSTIVSQQSTINLQYFAAGVYELRITAKCGSFVKKLVKQ